MKQYFTLVLKGLALGTANVIPGVSGGTIALITGIFERLIDAVKSFDITAIKLLLRGKVQSFIKYTDLKFLLSVFAGVVIAIITIARLFDYFFEHYPVYIWAYFFGLILASVFFVGKTITRWSWSVIVFLLLGIGVALIMTYLNPATENSNFFYLMICGVVAVCSMILPGLSGSFVLILMGNYQLVMIDAVNNARLDILLPVVLGAVLGLIGFSHFLSWVFKKYRNQTIALLTGFIFGSLGILWPWKSETYIKDDLGNIIYKHGEPVISGYQRYFPELISTEVLVALLLMIIGVISIWVMEQTAKVKGE